jgi:hypothetical protein
MNSDLVHSIVQNGPKASLVDRQILDRLVTEVRETVATDVEFSKARGSSFGVVGLWNIRRNSRYAAHTRNKKPRIVTGISY